MHFLTEPFHHGLFDCAETLYRAHFNPSVQTGFISVVRSKEVSQTNISAYDLEWTIMLCDHRQYVIGVVVPRQELRVVIFSYDTSNKLLEGS